MSKTTPEFELRLARDEAEIRAGQRLRYAVFIEELGGDGAMVDHDARLERDRFDPYFDHLLLFDRARPDDDQVVGAYRVMRDDQMAAAGRYYSETEYELDVLKNSGRKLLELGRSCVHRDYRGGGALKKLWQGLLGYVEDNGIEVMFGTASFHGTDPAPHALPLSLLHHYHLAPPELRVRARPEHFISMDLIDKAMIDCKVQARELPALIKAYLMLGGFVGEGAWVDVPFNTIDVCVVVDIARVPPRVRTAFARGVGR